MTQEYDYDNPWTLNGVPFTSEMIGDNFGFVYQLTFEKTGQLYIGRKYFYSWRKNGRKRRTKQESDWKRYYSSSDLIKQMISQYGKASFKREILFLCTGKGSTNFMETKLLWENQVLENDLYLNDNIAGKYFTGRVKTYLEEQIHRKTDYDNNSRSPI